MNKFKKLLINLIPVKSKRKAIRNQCYNDRLVTIKQHPNAASDYQSMKMFADWIITYSNIKPNIIFEIGANYGQDSAGLSYYLNVPNKNCYLFEAHPDICSEINKLYPEFNVYNYACYNENNPSVTFNMVDMNLTNNSGISSLKNNPEYSKVMKTVQVKTIRMDEFLKIHGIDSIDFLKLDVEGCNYEVLEGFGDKLCCVKAIHVEAEHREAWHNEKLYDDIKLLLEKNGFTNIYFQRYLDQSDSFWVQTQYLKTV